jgi:dUTP pyrophosphatase
METIFIRKCRADAELPKYGTDGSAAFDFVVPEDTVAKARGMTLVPTGLVFTLPHRHYMLIFARSSTPLKRGLIIGNGVGLVDEDYSGPEDEVKILVYNLGDNDVYIAAGDRIAQGMILPYHQYKFVEDHAYRFTGEASSRGGFGSTGS